MLEDRPTVETAALFFEWVSVTAISISIAHHRRELDKPVFKKVIKIPNKSFNDLNAEEMALMIEADSSLNADGNESFSSCALDEFLYTAELHREDLLALRQLVLDGIYIDKPGTTRKEIDSAFLRKLADKIRRGEIRIASGA